MTKSSLESSHDHARAELPPVAAPVPPAQREGNDSCDLYAAGHQIHYKHQGNAVRSPSVVVRDTLIDGTRVTLLLDDAVELDWRHHDPVKLRRILELLRGRCVIYPRFHALRVGPYWFNCASELDAWQDCGLSRAVASS